jgi:hypothetical protein
MRTAMFHWLTGSPDDPAAYDQAMLLAGRMRQIDPCRPIVSSLPIDLPHRTDRQVPEAFPSAVDVLASPIHWLSPSAARRRGRRLWLRPGAVPYGPPIGPPASPADVRAWPWMVDRYAAEGLLLPRVLGPVGDEPADASTAPALLDHRASVAPDAVLPTVRLKHLRRGIQDACYLWILRRRGRAGTADALAQALLRYAGLDAAGSNYLDPRLAGWVRDPRAWQQARRILAQEVADAVAPDLPSQDLRQRLAWKQLNARTRGLAVRDTRTRLRVVRPAGKDPNDPAPRIEARVNVGLANRYSRPAEARAHWTRLPAGWRVADPNARRRAILPALGQGEMAFTLIGRSLPTGSDGKMSAALAIEHDDTGRDVHELRLPLLLAGRTRRPIAVDGDLDDWPRRAGNSAASFRLIGRRGRHEGGLARRRTRVFVLTDGRSLRIAFRCAHPGPAQPVARPTNHIRYDQLLAMGEDLVEIILDPGGDARSPAELYHIVIKANGVTRFSHGIDCDPPLGPAVPWSVDARTAVGRDENHWTVELSLPLEAFGDRGQADHWAVNFARFTPAGSEASSWTGAPRHFYDPDDLGTLYIPPDRP